MSLPLPEQERKRNQIDRKKESLHNSRSGAIVTSVEPDGK